MTKTTKNDGQKVKLGEIANYSDTRVKCAGLSFENFVGTDNLIQNKQGKENSQYTPSSGYTTEYKKNDVLIANIRPYLKKIWFATNDGGSSADVLTIRINDDKFLPKFVFYNLFQDMFFDYAMKGAKGSKMPRGDKKQILNFPIYNPDFPTQSAIARVLSSLDDKIELNNKVNKELENLAKMIYGWLFIQNRKKKWKEETLGNIGDFKNGANYKKLNKKGTIVKIVNVRDISSSSSFIDETALDEIILPEEQVEKYLLSENDIIIARSGIPGAIRLIAHCENTIFCGFSIRFRLKNKSLKEYVYFVLKQNEQAATSKSGGSIMPNISQDVLKELKITIPDTQILRQFNKAVSPLFSTIIKNRQESANLAQLRDFLLPLLMNGQVTVGEKSVVKKTSTKQRTIFKRAVLSAYILDNICEHPTAGRVKFEKLLYLSEYCAEIDLQSDFHRHAAGPYDPKALYSLERQLKKNKWFEKKFDGSKNTYVRLEKIHNYKQYCENIFSVEQKATMDKLIRLFKTAKTEQCEIVATLYGVWNDFLIDGIQPTDEQIINEVLSNWHEEKRRIVTQRWLIALKWMREKNIVPVGYGISTKRGANGNG